MLSELIVQHLPGVVYHQPKATYLSWLDCNDLGLGDDPGSVFLEKASVRVNSGLDFGESGGGFVRLNFATSPELLASTLERMGKIL
jgi:cystathionine beta-lyase